MKIKNIRSKIQAKNNYFLRCEMDDYWIGLNEAAKYLGVNKDTIRNWIKKTDIPAYRARNYTSSDERKVMIKKIIFWVWI